MVEKCLTVFNVGEYIHVFTNFGWYNKELNLSKWNKCKDINIPHIKTIILKVIQDKEISFSKSTGRRFTEREIDLLMNDVLKLNLSIEISVDRKNVKIYKIWHKDYNKIHFTIKQPIIAEI